MTTNRSLHSFLLNKRNMISNSVKKWSFSFSYIECLTITYHVVNHTNRLTIHKKVRFVNPSIWQSQLGRIN